MGDGGEPPSHSLHFKLPSIHLLELLSRLISRELIAKKERSGSCQVQTDIQAVCTADVAPVAVVLAQQAPFHLLTHSDDAPGLAVRHPLQNDLVDGTIVLVVAADVFHLNVPSPGALGEGLNRAVVDPDILDTMLRLPSQGHKQLRTIPSSRRTGAASICWTATR
ncbi:hypothetical protein EYF80_000879 [Liparis tanakae]|uniref:Uncharacterized protein n=1 Tax=Liparis tanakae TaxID=230148 RepID=A0A4Z2JGA6_9TELE|nr:hypothetical protein EYF80_000879 [Liparis tanakae]